jgi:hypothetical protein
MKELFRTNDMVLISYLQHRLHEEGIEPLTLDGHMSVLEGSIGVLPRRIMVDEDDYDGAIEVLNGVRQERDRQA